jgi:hypothetical protein
MGPLHAVPFEAEAIGAGLLFRIEEQRPGDLEGEGPDMHRTAFGVVSGRVRDVDSVRLRQG